MTILLPHGLPAADTLRAEEIAVADSGTEGLRRTLRIGLVNLMPRKEASELAFARLLAQSGRDRILSCDKQERRSNHQYQRLAWIRTSPAPCGKGEPSSATDYRR